VIGSFIVFPQLRRYFSRLVVYLAISDLWLCVSFLMGQAHTPHLMKCRVQSCLGIFFGLSSILWTVAVADSLRRVLLRHDLSVESRHESRLHMFAWGVPCAILFSCAACGLLGPAGMLCWIKNTAAGTIARMISFYFPLWISIAYCMYVYWNIRSLMMKLLEQRKITAEVEETETLTVMESQLQLDKQQQSMGYLMLIPLVLVICWTPSSVRRLVDMFYPDVGWMYLDYLCAVAGPLQGLLNAVIYGATPAVRDAMLGRLHHSAQMMRAAQGRLKRNQSRSMQMFKRFEDDFPSSSFEAPSPPVLEPTTIGRSTSKDIGKDGTASSSGALPGISPRGEGAVTAKTASERGQRT